MLAAALAALALPSAFAADVCNDFKMKCQTTCLDQSGGVATNQCWGTPTYRLCKCSDGEVVVIAGYDCEHPSCPPEAKSSSSVASAPAQSASGVDAQCLRCDGHKSVSGFKSWSTGVSSDGSSVSTKGTQYGNALMCTSSDRGILAYASFRLTGSDSYGTIDVAVGNKAEAWDVKPEENTVDISKFGGIELTYQSNERMYLQLRHGANKHGGHHYRVALPIQAKMQTRSFAWSEFKQPSWAAAYALDTKKVFSFTFVTFGTSELLVSRFRIGSGSSFYEPPCGTLQLDKSQYHCNEADCTATPAVQQKGNPTAAPTTRAPTPQAAPDYVKIAADQAIRLYNLQYGGDMKLSSILEGSEKRVVGYNYVLKLMVFSKGGQNMVEAKVATTTYRDQYRLVAWKVLDQTSGKTKIAPVYTKPPTAAPAPQPEPEPASNQVQQQQQQQQQPQPEPEPSSGSSAAVTPEIYQPTYKQRGFHYPAVGANGECVDLKKPWPQGYVSCCPHCSYPRDACTGSDGSC